MGKTRSACVTTEQAAAHPGLSPRTLERYRLRRGGPTYVCYRNRVHELRSDLEDRTAQDGRPIAVESEDDCLQVGHETRSGKKTWLNRFFLKRGLERSGAAWSGPEVPGVLTRH